MNPQDLMKPRIIVENNYPRSPFKHYEIICEPSAQQVEWAKEFPVNFRFLNWWEHRKAEDMPKYVKHKLGGYYEVNKWDKNSVGAWLCDVEIAWFFIGDIIPSTESEYLQSKEAIKQIK